MDESIYRQALSGYRIFPPWLEILLGLVLLASGLVGSHGLWMAGHVEEHILALGLFGILGFANGVARAIAKGRLVRQLKILRQRESEILSTLSLLHRENKGCRAWLHSVGLTNPSLCEYLVKSAELSNK